MNTHLRLLFFFLFLGILVAEIAMDGLYTEETYLNHSLGIGPQSLTDFTLCQRMNLNYLRPIVTYSLSYTSFFSDNTLNIETRFNGDKLYLSVCKLKYVAKECGTYHLDGVQVHHEWYHICFVLKSKKLTSFTWETETILYINGIVVHEGTNNNALLSLFSKNNIPRYFLKFFR